MGETNLKVELLKHTPQPEETVAVAARLCYSADEIDVIKEKLGEKKEEFIKKLLNLGHLSPLEHVSFTFGIEGVSRSLLAQITRHRIASFSVKSQRYVSEKQEDDVFAYVVPPQIKELGEEYEKEFKEQMEKINDFYEYWCDVLKDKGKKGLEDARFVLPNATETKMVVTMNARELHHFFNLRCCSRAQWEIRALAWQMLKEVKKTAPAVFEGSGPACVNGPCKEGEMSCGEIEKVREYYKALEKELEV